MKENKKYYSARAISIATYLGGPLAAGYLVKKNYDTLDQPENGKKAFVIGIVSTIFLFVGIFFIPKPILDKIPRVLIPLIYTSIIYMVVETLHGEILKVHKESGGEFYSAWSAAGVGAISLIIILGIILIIYFLAGDITKKKANFDTSLYDKEMTRFTENQNKALDVIDAKPDSMIIQFKNGIEVWKINKEILVQLDTMSNLPKELIDKNINLRRYCDLRIKSNEIIIKAISENTDRYKAELEKIGFEIEKLLKELNKN